MDCKVSIVVPVYNVQNYLSQCLESILSQSLNNIEILCINDGSTDMSSIILDEYAKRDSRITVVHKKNEGYGASCNAGLKLARGEYFAIVEPDDFIDKNMYLELYTLALEHNAEIVKSAFFEYKDSVDSSGAAQKINWSENYDMPKSVFTLKEHPQFVYFHPSIWSCLYKREFLVKNNISFPEPKGAGWADNPFQVATMCLAKRIYYTDNAYYYYRLTNPTSSSNIVNITNPFDRSAEIHNFLENKRINDKGILANLYKRELGYIEVVLGGISQELFDYAYVKIKELVDRMNKNIVLKYKDINESERAAFENCKTRRGVEEIMKNLKAKKPSHVVTQGIN